MPSGPYLWEGPEPGNWLTFLNKDIIGLQETPCRANHLTSALVDAGAECSDLW